MKTAPARRFNVQAVNQDTPLAASNTINIPKTEQTGCFVAATHTVSHRCPLLSSEVTGDQNSSFPLNSPVVLVTVYPHLFKCIKIKPCKCT